MNRSPAISAIMIVRNEEEHLPVCLESIRNHVDEIVVVDTGSEDSSIEIAKGYGAKVFEHPWEDHFSKHRNQSVSYATGNWLFQIDADEELVIDGDMNLKEMVQTCDDVDSILVTLESRWGSDRKSLHNSIRLFKKLPMIHYEGRVHNEVTGMRTGRYMPIRLLHHGYDTDQDEQKRKFDRTVRLLLMDVQEDPENPRAHHYLGISYLSMNLLEKAVLESEKAIRLCRQHGNRSDLYAGSYYVASSASMRLGEMEKAEKWAMEAQKYYPMDLDSLFILARIYYEKQNLHLFQEYADRYLDRLEMLEKNSGAFGTFIFHTAGYRWLGHLYRACAWLDSGLQKKGMEELERAHRCCPDRAHYHHLLAGYYMQRGKPELSESEFMKALEESGDQTEIMWDFVRLKRQQDDLEGMKDLLEKILKWEPDHKNALFELGNIFLKRNEFERSVEYYSRVIKLDKNHRGAGINMALALHKLGRFEESIHCSLRLLKEHSSSIEIHSNLAYAYYGWGDFEKAAEHFVEMTRMDPHLPDPYVFLSHIFLMNGDLDSLVYSCDNLLRILKMKHDYLIESLQDLGARFLEIADRLKKGNKPYMAGISLHLGNILVRQNPSS